MLRGRAGHCSSKVAYHPVFF
uniref:Uncharacterized protein n=1 Tax=Arundo donax TaxID=35708 RepID=A0A0A9B131_ARUDO